MLRIYDESRRPVVEKYSEGSRRAGEIHEGHGEHDDSIAGIREDMINIISEHWHRDIDEDVKEAQAKLEEVLKRQ